MGRYVRNTLLDENIMVDIQEEEGQMLDEQ